MADELRLGTLGDQVLQTGATIPIPLAGDGMGVPIPAFGADCDLPSIPIPLYAGEPPILGGGVTIPTP